MNTLHVKGSSLIGLKYKPLFPYFSDQKNAFKIIDADFVTTTDGTGVVHLAPAFGEDDHQICSEKDIDLVCPVDEAGKFTAEVHDIEYNLAGNDSNFSIEGKQVFEANDDIIKYLKGKNLWLHTENYLHDYPFCWRTDTPLIYKKINSWFVKVTDIKDRMVELNQNINWVPGHVKNGSFGKWLENTRDWSISRNRFWGCPIPVWQSNDNRYPCTEVYGSVAELEEGFGEHYKQQHGKDLKITSLHRPFIDTLTKPNPNDPTGKSMLVRVTDVLDCWFESGSMPFASVHYPFEYKVGGKVVRTAEENQAWFKKNFPADFIVEYLAQTRGWFYTLMVLGTALFDSNPFKNCICHGVVLDEKSQKLSKRHRNYPDPMEVLDVYGSDALRFSMCKSNVMRGGEINIDKEGKFIQNTSRLVLMSIWNSFTFLKSYMDCDGLLGVSNKEQVFIGYQSPSIMDQYILSKVALLATKIEQSLGQYFLPDAFTAVEDFIDQLNNWYIRRSKKRFWSSLKFTNAEVATVKSLQLEVAALSHSQKIDLASSIATQSSSDTEMDIWDYVKCVLADIDINPQERDFRVQESDNTIVLIEQSKLDAYKTLYTTLYTFSKAVAPLLPCLSEKIFMDLISDNGNFDFEGFASGK